MEQEPPQKRKKSKQNKSAPVVNNDSSYGSMITGPSSSSSLSLSFFSESDLIEAPSTSGCSSEMASAMQTKEKKKERAKEFMKKLKSMLPKKERTGSMDILSTLEQLVNSMRQLNEEQNRDSEFKAPPPHNGSYQRNDSDRLSQSNMYISVSLKNHVVQMASPSLLQHLGYPVDWWKGRLLKDFIHKKDINTVNSCIALHSTDEDHSDVPDTLASTSTGGGMKEGSKYFYARIRRFRKLGTGFNLQNVVSFCPFMMMITTKAIKQTDAPEDETTRHRKSLMVYCQHLSSAYGDGSTLPQEREFSLRHSLFCNYTYVHPKAVRLLGFLPQDFNGMSIFDLYHPDDYQQLLDIHKKIMISMGQPFKSCSMRLKTRNGCYVEVETEWSSFVNPWSMQLEFIIGQHTVIKGPSRPDLFEDMPSKPEKVELSPDMRKIRENIMDVLRKPIQGVFAEPSPVAQPVKEQSAPALTPPPVQAAAREPESAIAKVVGVTEKAKGDTAPGESKSTVIDDKGISSIYNQLSYSHNIKRFLMSHPKSFSNLSDEDSTMTRDDSEDEAINDEEEMPLEIPVVKPPSCGSSTQVHVSEQGHGEEMLSPPTFRDEVMPPRESADSIHSLTEETLKKHTKIQERLYLQRISEEQPLLLNMRRIKSSRNPSHQKRPRPREAGEEMDTAKHPCTNSGVFRSSSNIFMQSFPAVTANETPPTPAQPMLHQPELARANYDNSFLGQSAQMGFQPFSSAYQSDPPVSGGQQASGQNVNDVRPILLNPVIGLANSTTSSQLNISGNPVQFGNPLYPLAGNQGNIALPGQPAVHLVPGEQVHLPCIPTSLGPMIPNQGLVDICGPNAPQNIQWPYYPQTGYTLMPQVMAGFYRPLLQPVQVHAVPAQHRTFMKGSGSTPMAQEPATQNENKKPQPATKVKTEGFDKKQGDSDNPSSSVEDTASSIMYLLEADSSTFEESDSKTSPAGAAAPRTRNKRSSEPPWLRGVKWNEDTKMRYQVPQKKMYSTLMMDDKMLKKTPQSDMVQANLEELLENISFPDYENPVDEEADYIFFPGDEVKDNDKSNDPMEEVDVTQSSTEVNDGGGGGTDEVVWSLGAYENDEDNYDTPVNSHSEEEKAPPTPTQADSQLENKAIQREGSPNLTSDKTGEESADISMETVFISNQQGDRTSTLTKRGSSPKDGSLSGDELSGSDGGQKAEMEDSQSNCSKVSSDLTPSDDRSNEEAGSSVKESDASLKHMKGVPSVASSNSSHDQGGQDEGATATQIQDADEMFKKLFVPLKVKVSKKVDTLTTPYWLVEAHLSYRVAMTYKMPTRQLEDILTEDKKKMNNFVQSAAVKQQLLQRLTEADVKSVATSPAKITPLSSAARTIKSRRMSLPPTSTETQSSLASSSALCTLEEDDKKLSKDHIIPSVIDSDPSMPSASASEVSGATTSIKTEGNSTLCEETSHLTLAKSSSSMSIESLNKNYPTKISPDLRAHYSSEVTSSDSNTDPVADEPRNSDQSLSSSSDATLCCDNSSGGGGSNCKADPLLQERFQAIESGSVTGQKIEDIIMSSVFMPVEMTNQDMKNNPNLFSLAD